MALSRTRKSKLALSKMGERNPMWRGAEASAPSGRSRARQRYDLGPCEVCERPAVDRHHRDGDTHNNEASNVQSLCRRCHMAADGRLDRLRRLGPKRKPVEQPCRNCGRMVLSIRTIRCGACAQYWRFYGVERPADRLRERGLVRRNPQPRPPLDGQTCSPCGRPARDSHVVGGRRVPMCRRCKMRADGRSGQPPKPCASCRAPSKPLRRGLCGRCYDAQRVRDWTNGGRPLRAAAGGG